MDAPSKKVKLCNCPKCLRNSENGRLLNPVTYWRHAKYRELETIVRRAALSAQSGLPVPDTSSSSAGGSNRMQSMGRVRRISLQARQMPNYDGNRQQIGSVSYGRSHGSSSTVPLEPQARRTLIVLLTYPPLVRLQPYSRYHKKSDS